MGLLVPLGILVVWAILKIKDELEPPTNLTIQEMRYLSNFIDYKDRKRELKKIQKSRRR